MVNEACASINVTWHRPAVPWGFSLDEATRIGQQLVRNWELVQCPRCYRRMSVVGDVGDTGDLWFVACRLCRSSLVVTLRPSAFPATLSKD
jgi:hypothetical protein